MGQKRHEVNRRGAFGVGNATRLSAVQAEEGERPPPSPSRTTFSPMEKEEAGEPPLCGDMRARSGALDRLGRRVERVGDRLNLLGRRGAAADPQPNRRAQVQHRAQHGAGAGEAVLVAAVEAREDRVDLRLVGGQERLALGRERVELAPAASWLALA